MLKESLSKIGNESSYFGDKITALNQENYSLHNTISQLKKDNSQLKSDLESKLEQQNKTHDDHATAKSQI